MDSNSIKDNSLLIGFNSKLSDPTKKLYKKICSLVLTIVVLKLDILRITLLFIEVTNKLMNYVESIEPTDDR